MSTAFGADLVMSKVENAEKNASSMRPDLIRGVPKFVETSTTGLRYARKGELGHHGSLASSQLKQ